MELPFYSTFLKQNENCVAFRASYHIVSAN